jgi:hypothetical protein
MNAFLTFFFKQNNFNQKNFTILTIFFKSISFIPCLIYHRLLDLK